MCSFSCTSHSEPLKYYSLKVLVRLFHDDDFMFGIIHVSSLNSLEFWCTDSFGQGRLYLIFLYFSSNPPSLQSFCICPQLPQSSHSTACLFVTILWSSWGGEGALLPPWLVTLRLRSLLPSFRENLYFKIRLDETSKKEAGVMMDLSTQYMEWASLPVPIHSPVRQGVSPISCVWQRRHKSGDQAV